MSTYMQAAPQDIHYVPVCHHSHNGIRIFPKRSPGICIDTEHLSAYFKKGPDWVKLNSTLDYQGGFETPIWVRVDALAQAAGLSSEDHKALRENPHAVLKERVFDPDMQRLQQFAAQHASPCSAQRYSRHSFEELPYSVVITACQDGQGHGLVSFGEDVGFGAEKTVKELLDCQTGEAWALAVPRRTHRGTDGARVRLSRETEAYIGLQGIPGIPHIHEVQFPSERNELETGVLMQRSQSDLKMFLRNHPDLPLRVRREIMRQVTTTVYHMMANDVYMQDLKSENLLIDYDPKSGKVEVTLIDLSTVVRPVLPSKKHNWVKSCFDRLSGLPKPVLIGDALARVPLREVPLCYTPMYAPPEAFVQSVEEISDIEDFLDHNMRYALGCVLYLLECGTTDLPWASGRSWTVIGRQQSVDKAFRDREKTSINTLIHNLLSDDPETRPSIRKVLSRLQKSKLV